jgi:AICAR transformylase/IMP cyclohydrolase PurH
MKMSTALISVTDKTGLPELAAALSERGIHLIASSGACILEERGIPSRRSRRTRRVPRSWVGA